ncbi:increased DNA methylation 1 [Morus notabilis]|uniref:increased DNA methylation 1 n=1 Tax=Morus notabilis TaxID=981085 RepID=UPI000CED5AF7|nr:increased DNA methylation 1 [Morus notabilis]XP_024029145.1 increased DNA methylation 1 [Morus notabilis]
MVALSRVNRRDCKILNSVKLVEMLLDDEIEDLIDDGFEGSQVEQSLFREIFFRNDTGSASKKCLVTGVINFECESSKNTATSLCSNSENSVLTSHSSSKNACLDDFSNVTEEFRETSQLESFPVKFAYENRNGGEASDCRKKSSVHKPPNAEPDLGNASSAFREKNASSAFCPVTEPISEVVTLRLVECSSEGLTSSCYLLKQHGGMVRGCRVVDSNVSKCRSQSLEGNDAKEAIIGKAIASPASQESFASRLLAASPSVNVQERFESPLHAEERPQEHQSFELDLSDVALKTNLKKDPRQLLQYHVVDLLRAAGWRIERRKRPSRQYMESVYRTPKGRPVREFAKAWRLCGQLLSAYSLVEEDDGREWANIAQFFLDLSDTLVILEKGTNHSELSCRWRLLDPFVIVAFINRKIGALRKGEVVKATCSLAADRKLDVRLTLTNTDSVGHQIAKKDPPPTSICGSVLAGESALVVSEGNFHNSCEQYGNIEYSGLKNNEAVKFTKGMPLDTAKGEGMLLVNASNEFGDLRSLISGVKTSSLDMTSFATHGTGPTGSTVVQSTNCQISDKQSSDCNVGTTKEVNSFNNNAESLARQVTDIGHYLLTSGDNHANNKGDALVPFEDSDAVRHLTHVEEDDRQQFEVSELTLVDTSSPGDIILKKKTRRKSKRISEMEPSSLYQSGNHCSSSVDEADLLYVNGKDIHLELNQVQGDLVANERIKGTCKKSSYLKSSHHQMEKKSSKLKRNFSEHIDSRIVKKKSARCRIEDDDLLVSAIIRNKDFIPSNARYTSRKKACKSRARRKLKSQKRTCRLLPSLVNGGKHFKDGKWYSVGVRTVLSWLIGSGVISLNDVIQYRNPKDDVVIKEGVITRDGILCKCCSNLLMVSVFKIHAGFKHNRPCLNLFMGSGQPFTICLLEAWSAEYKTRKGGSPTVQVDENDQNDDSCGLCGDGGELICCDNCPSTFHQACLSAKDLPEGSWYCPNCTCWICGSLVNDKDVSSASDGLKCSQCEHKYHEACLKEKGRYQAAMSDSLFCGSSCQEVYHGLQARVGVFNNVADDFSWALLKCIHDDQKIHSAQRFALKAECNSRLAVALTIMEECFLSMVDPRTGIDMIPHVLYNWGSEFARLNFQGFYTVVLEKDDVLISVASIRVHGTTVAEMPLIATCSKYRRQGMCRRLVTAIEEMLKSFKVEKIVVAAIPDLVQTWTEGFGFTPVEDNEKQSLNKINLMVFPGTVLLKKPLYDNRDTQAQSGDRSGLRADESTKVDDRFCADKFKKQFIENDIVECNKLTEFECSTKVKVIDGDIGVDGMSSVGIEESSEVDFNSRELIKFGPCYAAKCCTDAENEPMGSKNLPRSEVYARTDKKTAEQQSTVHCHCIRGGAETSEGCWKSEIRRVEEVVKPVQHQSNGNCCANEQEVGLDGIEVMQVGEDERISLQDQFSKLSCEDPTSKLGDSQPETVSGVESFVMYDETQVSLDEQLKKACEVNVR